MPEDHMRYDLLAQDALRGVVRLALLKVKREGLPGDHHFFIAFGTKHPGVGISERLGAKYEDEMTIVLQHQFWNLEIFDHYFEVELSFDNIPEKLVVPFAAVKGFFDPSVQFGLQFEMSEEDDLPGIEPEEAASVGDGENTETTPEMETGSASNDDSTVVSLDQFRKK